MNKKIKLSLVASALLANVLCADDLGHITVTSATKTEQSIKDVTSNIEVITSAEIEEKHYTSIAQVLNNTTGVTVSQTGGIGQSVSFYLRGFSSGSTLILINGVEFNNPTTTGGQAQIEHLTISDVDRIEIIKGAQSGIYGANATAGIINIVTKKATKKLNINSNIEAGSFNTKKINLSASQKIDKFSFYVGFNKITTDGFTSRATRNENIDKYEDDKYKNQTLNSNVSYDLSDNDIIDIKYTYIDTEVDYDKSITDQNGHTISQKDKILNTSFVHNYSPDNYSKIFYTKATFLKKDPTGYTKKFDGENNKFGIDTKINYNNNDSFVLFGANKKDSKDIVNNKNTDSSGLYITSSNKVDKTIVTATIRKDKYSEFKNKTTGKLGLKYFFSNSFDISSNYGTSYKIPSLYNLYDSWAGDTSLIPELVKSFDLQFGYKNFKLTYFTNDIENEILYSSTNYKYYNSLKKSTIKGLEFKYQDEIFENTLLNFDHTIFNAKDEDNYQLAKRPKNITNIAIDYYGFANYHINLNAQHIGDRVEYTFGTHTIDAQTGNYTTINTVVNYDMSQTIQVYGKCDNITDKYYQTVDGYATSPRAFYAGVKVKF